MAIQPPSDILLDVANAADPVKVRAATARLAKLAAEPNVVDADFGRALKAAGDAGRTLSAKSSSAGRGFTSAVAMPPASPAATASRPSLKGAAQAYQKFETVLLQNFVEAMLPKDDNLYGDKTSAGIYRSMMAEQFASQLSKAGGIGIAKAIEAKHPSTKPAAEPTVMPLGLKPTTV